MYDWNGFDKGVIGKKLPADTTLNNMKKAELIKLLHLAESNHKVLAETYRIAVDNSKCNTCPISKIKAERDKKIYSDAIDDALDVISKLKKDDTDEYGMINIDKAEVYTKIKRSLEGLKVVK